MTRWSDVNSDLPASRIEVFGPPPTSGTRDAFVELDMIDGARRIECLAELEDSAPGRFDEIAARIREDGGWVDSGENDNTIVQTLANAPNSFGIFGYSFLEQNGDRIQAATIDGILPTYEAISNGEYPRLALALSLCEDPA
jgi:phosphate transport system substrate-binding protein